MPRLYKGSLLLFFLLFWDLHVNAQQYDFSFIEEKNKVTEMPKTKPTGMVRKFLYGGIRVYQILFSESISSECLYHPTCSRFGHEALQLYNPIKAVLITMDRVSRCNRLSATDVHPVRLNPMGTVTEPAIFFEDLKVK